MKWLELTAPEVAGLAAETDVVIIPIGSIESHGPHMPSGADGFKAERVAVEAAELEKAIVFPCLFLNANAPVKPLPGVEFELEDPAVVFPPELVAKIIKQIALEAARIGFNKVLCLSGHGPTGLPVKLVQYEIQEEAHALRKSGKEVPLIFMANVLSMARKVSREMGLSLSADGGHGGACETAITAACVSDLVDLEQAKELKPQKPRPNTIEGLSYAHNWPKKAPRGYQGRPGDATLEEGQKILQGTAEELAGMIRELKDYDVNRDI